MSELGKLVDLLNSAGYEKVRYNPLNQDGQGPSVEATIIRSREELVKVFGIPKSYLNTAEPKSLSGRVYPKEFFEKMLREQVLTKA